MGDVGDKSYNTIANIQFIRISDRLPEHGAPVLIVANNTVQYITYMLTGESESTYRFTPYHYEDFKVHFDDVTEWAYLPE